MNATIERLESNVRSYSRAFPTVFKRAEGALLFDKDGRRYVDFFAGAGALNYGHNPPALRDALIGYLQESGIAHGLDMATEAKCAFLETFDATILKPRGLDYRTMFPGPTGTNAVEAAVKLARKVTGRTHVVSFTNAFHGMTLGALALTGNAAKRRGAGVPLGDVHRMPFAGSMGTEIDTIEVMETMLQNSSSGLEAPAAFIVETVQGEGGIHVASRPWLQRLASLARRMGALLIVDDIQMGCGRTGAFFSFEELGVTPDIVCLSKSISGFGLPMALVLFRPALDVWNPGEHNGTFRGNNLAFVTATVALQTFWQDRALRTQTESRSVVVRDAFSALASRHGGRVRGRGFVWGVSFQDPTLAGRAARAAFEAGLVIETAGPQDEVLKFLAPLTISDDELGEGLAIVTQSVTAAAHTPTRGAATAVRGASKTATQTTEVQA